MSDVKAGDTLPLLNAKAGSSSLEVTVSLFILRRLFLVYVTIAKFNI